MIELSSKKKNNFKKTVLKTTDIQVLKNTILHHKMLMFGGGGLLQRLSTKISSNIRYTITHVARDATVSPHCLVNSNVNI